MAATSRIFDFGEYRLDVTERLLIGPGKKHSQLTGRTMDALLFMVEHAGQLLDKQSLMAAAWKEVVVEENSLNQLVDYWESNCSGNRANGLL